MQACVMLAYDDLAPGCIRIAPAAEHRSEVYAGRRTRAFRLSFDADSNQNKIHQNNRHALTDRPKYMMQLLPDALGFLGSLLMVIPYLRHHPLRRMLDLFQHARPSDPDVRRVAAQSTADLAGYLRVWDRRDYRLTAIGVALLCLSFLAKMIVVGMGEA